MPLSDNNGAGLVLPESCFCPITQQLLVDPVIDPEGYTFERAAILAWLASSGTSPVSRTPLTAGQLVPNRALVDLLAVVLPGGRTATPPGGPRDWIAVGPGAHASSLALPVAGGSANADEWASVDCALTGSWDDVVACKRARVGPSPTARLAHGPQAASPSPPVLPGAGPCGSRCERDQLSVALESLESLGSLDSESLQWGDWAWDWQEPATLLPAGCSPQCSSPATGTQLHHQPEASVSSPGWREAPTHLAPPTPEGAQGDLETDLGDLPGELGAADMFTAPPQGPQLWSCASEPEQSQQREQSQAIDGGPWAGQEQVQEEQMPEEQMQEEQLQENQPLAQGPEEHQGQERLGAPTWIQPSSCWTQAETGRDPLGRPTFVCPWEGCGVVVHHRGNLVVHLRTHTKEKVFQCQEPGCGKRFAHLGPLKEHGYSHRGVRPFVCPVPGCGRGFTSQSNRRRHVQAHPKPSGNGHGHGHAWGVEDGQAAGVARPLG